MQHIDGEPPASSTVLSHCPECAADLEVLRVMAGREGSEYWAMQCTCCDRIHLNIVKPPAPLNA